VQVDVQQCRQQPKIGRDRGLEREQVKNPSLDVQVELVHLVIAPDHLFAAPQVAARKRLQRHRQQQVGLGACSLHVALKGAQLLMKALPDLGHQLNRLRAVGLHPRSLGHVKPCPSVRTRVPRWS
jgi:hypothetical protein